MQSVRFPHLDLVIAIDVTNSMRNEIDGLKTELDGMASVLARLAPSVAVGIVAFGDREWDRPLTSFPLEEISSSAAGLGRLADFVDTLEANMGLGGGTNNTRPEAFLAALRAAARMQWRSQAERRQVVVSHRQPGISRGGRRGVGRGVVLSGEWRRTVRVHSVRAHRRERAGDGGVPGARGHHRRRGGGAGGRIHDREPAAFAALDECPGSGRFLWGRDPSCDFHIADESVSRRHAEVVLAGDGRFFVTDRGSTRGTFVLAGQDWEPVRQAYVAATARIRFGGYDMPAARLAVLGGRLRTGRRTRSEP